MMSTAARARAHAGSSPPCPLIPACQEEDRCCSGTAIGSWNCDSRTPWTSFPVAASSVRWPALMASLKQEEAAPSGPPSSPFFFMDSIKVFVVEKGRHVTPALKELRDSLTDPIVAIDLEWKPDRVQGQRSRIAMIQLASASVVVLIRTCQLGWQLPAAVQDFLMCAEPPMLTQPVHLRCRDTDTVLVGFDWDRADGMKWRASFGFDLLQRRAMQSYTAGNSFIDLQEVATALGYGNPKIGLGALAHCVLDVKLNKDRNLSMCNWQVPHLTLRQLHYAALDALLASHILRQLRELHISSELCFGCDAILGSVPFREGFVEEPQNWGSLSWKEKRKHIELQRHWIECRKCSRRTVHCC